MTAGEVPSVARRPSRRGVLALRVAGVLVAALALGLCARTLADSWPAVHAALADAGYGWLVPAVALSAVAVAGLGLVWWRCLALFDRPVPVLAASAWYLAGELGKYVPGGVWTVLGRGELARRSGRVTRTMAYATTLVSYGAMCVGAGLVCGVLGPLVATTDGGAAWGWPLVALVPVGATVMHPRLLGPALRLGGRLTGGRFDPVPVRWSAAFGLAVRAAAAWLALGAGAVAVTAALDLPQSVPRVACAAVAAWIIGFFAVPVPAGAGIRELAFVGLCGLPAGPATAVAVLARVLLVLVDAVGGLLGLAYSARSAAARRFGSDR